jgi:hypothetical protein
MATWASLTPPQQQQVLAWMPLLRSGVITLVQSCNAGASLDGIWTASVSALVNSLDADTVVPDSTGLAGAQPLAREDVINLMTAIESLLASANTSAQRAEYLKVVGPVNMG